MRRALLCALACTLAACGDDGEETDTDTITADPDFPADYQQSYTEVRDCRGSGDHNLNNVRILASPSALTPYQDRVDPFPIDAVVIKEEYAFDDTACTGPISRWTVMRKLEAGSAPETLDWTWQDVTSDRTVIEVDGTGCVNCHTGCGNPPDGYDGTCSIPP
ncbi:MAG: cytochrome P460 family protein [Nannocystaceae bacterium]|nr:cytochrome P460 family protein [Myxococcales bacterium]